jgi:hypothetical protein
VSTGLPLNGGFHRVQAAHASQHRDGLTADEEGAGRQFGKSDVHVPNAATQTSAQTGEAKCLMKLMYA